jgi:LPXTG-motif cell wall-anchored protein
MSSIWILAAGALAVVAAALVVRRGRRDDTLPSSSAVGAVSEEWLSNARGQSDQGW